MKWSTIRISIKEGLSNILRHPVVILASVITISLMLFIMGAFTAFSMNARTIMTRIAQKPSIELTLNLGISPDNVADIEQRLKVDPAIIEYTISSPQENLESFINDLGDDQIFDGFEADNLPYTINVRLADPATSQSFAAQFSGIPGISKVSLEVAVMTFMSKAVVWINIVTFIVFTVLLVISLFIISNMVRIAVLARGDEISIKKYIGATNWFIRVPFIIEGALVGLIGALISFFLIYLVYDSIYNVLMQGSDPDMLFAMIPQQSVALPIIGLCLLIGILVGAVGSGYSVRRYIKV